MQQGDKARERKPLSRPFYDRRESGKGVDMVAFTGRTSEGDRTLESIATDTIEKQMTDAAEDGTFCVQIGSLIVMQMSDLVRAMLIAGGKGEEVAKYANGFYIRAAGGGMFGPLPTSETAVDIATIIAQIEGTVFGD